jgi:hypothetical protein
MSEEAAMTGTESQTERVAVIRAPVARSWSLAQLIAPAIGFVFIAWGLINIGHSGFHPERVFQPHDALAGLHYTPFLAALEVGFGLAMLIGGALLRAAHTRIRSLNGLAVGLGMVIVTLAGGAALGLGIVILIDAWPTQLHHWLNADHRDGVLYLVAGAVALTAAIASPVVLAPAESPSPHQPELASPPKLTPAPDSPHPKPDLVPAPDAG